jgi:hypothetical protein
MLFFVVSVAIVLGAGDNLGICEMGCGASGGGVPPCRHYFGGFGGGGASKHTMKSLRDSIFL